MMRAHAGAQNHEASILILVTIYIQVQSWLRLALDLRRTVHEAVKELGQGLRSVGAKRIDSPAEMREVVQLGILARRKRLHISV